MTDDDGASVEKELFAGACESGKLVCMSVHAPQAECHMTSITIFLNRKELRFLLFFAQRHCIFVWVCARERERSCMLVCLRECDHF